MNMCARPGSAARSVEAKIVRFRLRVHPFDDHHRLIVASANEFFGRAAQRKDPGPEEEFVADE
jgi:hypothetical protein